MIIIIIITTTANTHICDDCCCDWDDDCKDDSFGDNLAADAGDAIRRFIVDVPLSLYRAK